MKWIKDLYKKITSIAQDKLLHINVCGLITMFAILSYLCVGINDYLSCVIGWIVGFIFGIGKEVFDEKKGSFFDETDLIADLIGNTTIALYTLAILLLL